MNPGFYSFWFWNGPLDEAEIRWQIGQMAEQGLRGFFIHPRQGMTVPYLSSRFFDLVRYAIDHATRLGLRAQLYDEFPYPSGSAGGMVFLGQPWHMATRLVQGKEDVAGGTLRRRFPPGLLLHCSVFPVRDGTVEWDNARDLRGHVGVGYAAETYQELERGLTDYNRRRYAVAEPCPELAVELPEGAYRLFWSVQALVDDAKYFGHDVDVLNASAVEEFLSLTHDRYARELGDRLGRAVDSMFVDETAPHWSPELRSAFEDAYGDDLCALMPALQDASHPSHLKVSRQLFELRYRLFCERFERPYAARCRRLGLAYTGEKPSMRLSQLSYMDMPGCDPGHVKVGRPLDLLRGSLRGNARAVASVVWIYGKAGGVCECYHSTGWGATLQDARYVAEGLVLLGVEHLVPHGFFATTHGLAKHDAPPTYFFQTPYWRFFGCLSRRVECLTEHFRGVPHVDLIVVDPTPGLPSASHLDAFESLQAECMRRHLQFLLADLEMLRTGRIEAGCVVFDKPGLRVKVMVVPDMRDPEPGLCDWLEEFARGGGTVLSVGAFASAVAGKTERPEGGASLVPALSLSGPGHEQVWLGTRMGADGMRRHFLLNQGKDTACLSLPEAVEEQPLNAWETSRLEAGDGCKRRRLVPGESCLLYERMGAECPLPVVRIPIGGACTVQPDRSNLLRLDRWDLCVRGGAGAPDQHCGSVRALPVAELIERHGLRLRPSLGRQFLTAPRLALPMLDLEYRAQFVCDYSGPVWLVVEPGSLVGEWRLRCNEGAWLSERDLVPGTHHVRGSVCAPVVLRRGENAMTVELKTNLLEGGLRNPLYLAGAFAVDAKGPRLFPASPQGQFEDWDANGLPYYAGEVSYTFERRLDDVPAADHVLLELVADVPWEDAAEVRCNGSEWFSLPWNPRTVVIPASLLRCGDNRIEIRSATTLLRAFEGQWFDPRRHAQVDIAEWVSCDRKEMKT